MTPGTVGLIGCGMLGGSLMLDLRARGIACHVHDDDERIRWSAENLGVVWHNTLSGAVAPADCVVIAVPRSAAGAVLAKVQEHASLQTTIVELSSVKQGVQRACQQDARVILANPMLVPAARGWRHAHREYLAHATLAVITPARAESLAHLMRTSALAECCSMPQLMLDAASHDRIAALGAHLPLMVALSALDAVPADDRARMAHLAGEPLHVLAALVADDPAVNTDLLRSNAPALRSAARTMIRDLQNLVATLDDRGPEALEQRLRQGMERTVARPPGGPRTHWVPLALPDDPRARLQALGNAGTTYRHLRRLAPGGLACDVPARA